jgi:4-phytase / acid phosphatase
MSDHIARSQLSGPRPLHSSLEGSVSLRTVRLLAILFFGFSLFAIRPAAAQPANADLQMVVVLSRHGVRSPLTKQSDLDKYSAASWPKWDVASGIQTEHGDQLIKILGGWDRAHWSAEGLFDASGCAGADRVTIIADTDQRTRSTGKMLAEGAFPGCNLAIHAQPESATNDPLFRPTESGKFHFDSIQALAAVSGRMGRNPGSLTAIFRPQLEALDRVLAGCGKLPANSSRASLFNVPAGLSAGSDGTPSLRGPVPTAATLTENLLLEYTQGMSDADTGWGCLDGATLRFLMQMSRANWDYGRRTPTVARLFASNLLDHIAKSMQQSVDAKPVAGALGKPGDRLLILVGHDTNIATVAGALGLDWTLDGLTDGTPPGGALMFELWRSRSGGQLTVRAYYIAQSIDEMRQSQPLTADNGPGIAPIFIPGCSGPDLTCTWDSFTTAIQRAIDPAYVVQQP